ncbi:class II fructose-bisphosphate aldolase [Clostridium estertheticum]|uniref:class II fructose-bisphosphate aldolase n=1 Tax=Clostridium estertheticum TaxID=238834 RepID=UPI001C7CDDFE|nr:class II fructose-bisphosphate aldolase [Clostridium estertheticum]MBX4270686.1 class II aldolase [Clostridium estertheticum]WLC78537.1 class II aldolase [Clostridium estertheticum]
MSLVGMKDLLSEAEKGKYAVGSFSIANMEMIMGAIKAGEELKSPMILQIAEVRLNHTPLCLIGPMMIAAAKNAKVPVSIHLDHGITIERIKEALEIGFTSVMIDGSKHTLKENMKLTKEVISEAIKYNADVEAEIGRVGGSEDGSENLSALCTGVNEAKEFYDETSVDALAVAIGNAHGVYLEKPELNFDVLDKINKSVGVPLVLHGGTGISEDDFRKCISLGIRKINIATATFASVEENVRRLYKQSEKVDYFELHQAEIEGAYLNVKRHMLIFGSQNKA